MAKPEVVLYDYDGPGERWEDLRFPATAINPPGQLSDPDWDTTNGGWLFDATVTELLYVIAQLPHGWKEGSPLRPHVHWQKSTSAAGNVLWRLEYKWAPINEVMDADFTTVDVSSPSAGTPDIDTANHQMVSTFGEIANVSDKQVSDMLVMKVSRIGGDAADTYGADARFLEFDIHHILDSRGTINEFQKINKLTKKAVLAT